MLGLDATATQYLLSLSTARPRQRRSRREVVPAGIRQRLETALSPRIRTGENRLRSQEPELPPDREQAIAGMVVAFRTSLGTDVEPRASARG